MRPDPTRSEGATRPSAIESSERRRSARSRRSRDAPRSHAIRAGRSRAKRAATLQPTPPRSPHSSRPRMKSPCSRGAEEGPRGASSAYQRPTTSPEERRPPDAHARVNGPRAERGPSSAPRTEPSPARITHPPRRARCSELQGMRAGARAARAGRTALHARADRSTWVTRCDVGATAGTRASRRRGGGPSRSRRGGLRGRASAPRPRPRPGAASRSARRSRRSR